MIVHDRRILNTDRFKGTDLKSNLAERIQKYSTPPADIYDHWEEAAKRARASSNWKDYSFCLHVLDGYEAKAKRNQKILLAGLILLIGLIAFFYFLKPIVL